ncbi:ferritin-like domain-containing protein [Krasilnikovia sp. MM14-A1004]|uniref:ferritin-like domain-containing protein n=1 Tax=Krasilnikovia sp. MM14-A1004 TaxID=3373541 RepID=UPI00399D47DD
MTTVRPAPTSLAPATSTAGDSQRWLLSFYRISELSGALFFGRLARAQRPGPVHSDLTRHFADEAQHARYWTDCLEQLGEKPQPLGAAYQDQYLAATGLPANLMEVLAITSVFEQRVMRQYARHLTVPDQHPLVTQTLRKIMEDERWHVKWVREELIAMEPEYGKDHIAATLRRMTEADEAVYAATLAEHADRVEFLFTEGSKRA